MESFSKFGSDVDQATQNILDKGARNVEILKQPQYAPLRVEEQIAIIFCGVKGLLQKVPIGRIKNFETDLLRTMHEQHQDILDTLKSGKIDDDIMNQLTEISKEVSKKFEK